MPPYTDALLTHLFRLHSPMVLRRALGLLGNRAEAEEAMQEVFIKAMTSIESARSDDLTGWFYRMTTNHCLNRLRDQKRRLELIDEKVAPVVEQGTRPDPDAMLTLRWLLANADVRQARAVVYVHVDGLRQAQVAELMGVTERTVRTLLRRFARWADQQLAGQGGARVNFEELTAALDRWPDDAPSRLDIDRLCAGEVEGEAAVDLQRRIEASPEASAYFKRRGRGFDDDPIDPRVSLAAIRRGIDEARGARDRWRWLRRLVPVVAACAVGAAAIVLFVPEKPDPIGTVRLKGELRLRVFRRVASGAEEVLSGDPFAPGDVLRFRVDLPGPGRVSVMGIEGDGTAYIAWPPPDSTLPTRFAGRGVDLPEAVALDEAPGTERLHLIWCPDPVEPRCTSAGAGAPPSCPEGCRTTPYVLRKVAP